VDLRGVYRPQDGVTLDTDPEVCSTLAADHFLDRGFRHLVFCGYPGVGFSDQRCQAFVQCVEARGFVAEVFVPPRDSSRKQNTITRETTAEFSEHGLDTWLTRLSKPVAVFACNDVRARQVLNACHRASLAVPDDVAVLGVDNDEVICDLSFPSLSSIEPNTKQIGYEGAALLDQMMSGNLISKENVLIAPTGVHVRRSSDVLAVEDRNVATALRYIRDHACEGVTVQNVVRNLAVSRTTLDRRFHDVLGRSPKDEIDRIRVERARQLLELTDHKLATIANMVGYGMAPQFVTAFKRLTGVTPGEFRRCGSLPGQRPAIS
jgi:LacI family transcriptional regulator